MFFPWDKKKRGGRRKKRKKVFSSVNARPRFFCWNIDSRVEIRPVTLTNDISSAFQKRECIFQFPVPCSIWGNDLRANKRTTIDQYHLRDNWPGASRILAIRWQCFYKRKRRKRKGGEGREKKKEVWGAEKKNIRASPLFISGKVNRRF